MSLLTLYNILHLTCFLHFQIRLISSLTKSVQLTPNVANNTTNISVLLGPGASIISNKWNINVNSQQGTDLQLILGSEWGFNPTYTSTIELFIYGNTHINTLNTDGEIILIFNVNDKYFAQLKSLETSQNNPYEQCPDQNTPLITTNITSILNPSIPNRYDRYCNTWQNADGNYNDPVGWPMFLSLTNDPTNNSLHYKWGDYQGTPAHKFEITYTSSFQPNQGLNIHISGDTLNENFNISRIDVTYLYNPSTSPSKSPTNIPTTLSPTDNPTTKSPTQYPPTTSPTNNPTMNPTHKPTSQPTYNPTLAPTYNPTIEPTVNPSTTPTLIPIITTHNSATALTASPSELNVSVIVISVIVGMLCLMLGIGFLILLKIHRFTDKDGNQSNTVLNINMYAGQQIIANNKDIELQLSEQNTISSFQSLPKENTVTMSDAMYQNIQTHGFESENTVTMSDAMYQNIQTHGFESENTKTVSDAMYQNEQTHGFEQTITDYQNEGVIVHPNNDTANKQ